jgi:hypothetical protein
VNKISFKWSNMVFINPTKTKGILADVVYATADAESSTSSYKRYDLSAMYLTPVFKDKATFAGGLATYILDYETKDKDFNKTVNLTLTKPFKDWLSGTLLGSYVLNDSDTSSQEYDKWTVGFLFSAEIGF